LKRLKDYILIFGKGLCMGATEVVHGVSGSTMALILGVYQEFIQSLRSIDRKALRLFIDGRFADGWKQINGNFILPLLAGVITSLLLLTRVVSSILQTYFIPATALFFGLILISGILLLRKIRQWKLGAFIAIPIGAFISFYLTIIAPVHTPNNYFFVFLAGILAGLIMAFPGISSAFILLLIGKYQFIVTSFGELNPGVMSIFFLGSLLGLWMSSRFMYRMFADYYSITVALLCGLMLGALNKLWPWRRVFEYVTTSKGEQMPAYDESVLPWHYLALTGKDPQVFQAILMMALGVFIVVLIEKVAAGLKTKI
jgi:putative membrane protein